MTRFRTCIAANCYNTSLLKATERISFHKFPFSNPELLKKWLNAGQYKQYPYKTSRLCSEHFADEAYVHRRQSIIIRDVLLKDAVPSIFLSFELKKNVKNENSASETKVEENGVEKLVENHTKECSPVRPEEEPESPSVPNVVLDWDSDEDANHSSEESDSTVTVEEETMGEEVEQISFDNLCRICSKKFETQELVPIFEDEYTFEKISSFLPLMIHQGDNLPHNVCETCLQIVNSGFELIIKAQCSEQHFFKLINNLNTVLDENTTLCSDDDTPRQRKHSVTLDLHKKFNCDICGEELQRVEDLDEHIQLVHENQSAPPNLTYCINTICSLCGQLFESEDNYILHKCENLSKCSSCKKVFKTKCLLNRHAQNMCKVLFYCQHCYRSFTAKAALIRHMQIHPEAISFKGDCAACEKKSYETGFFEHTCMDISSTKFSSSKKYRCYICGRGYKRQMNLTRHCMQHEPKSTWKFECQKCGEMFEKERLLHLHYEMVHKMPKTWICRFCGKNLATKLSMQIHERIHTQVKPYVCEWCGNAFRSKANLIQHHAKHTGVKRHKCPVCGKMFSRTFFLKTHLRVHTGERPFQCDICEQRFTQVGDMRRHRRRHDQPSSGRQAVYIVRRPPTTPTVPAEKVQVEAVQTN